jgi:putative ABC transport system permease protein
VLGVFALEFAALGFVTALAAAAFGAVAAWMVIRFVMNLEWILLPDVVALTVLGAMALTLGFGLVGAVGATRQRPLALLRNE